MNENICFLTYMARSGSTLLARELDKYKAIGVTIEDDIPDGLLDGAKVFIEDEKGLEEYLDVLFSKPKFRFWNIPRNQLVKKLREEANYPLHIGDILRKLYEIYFSGQHLDAWIHKKGRYYLNIEEVRGYLPEAKFIHLKRDPRALFNSQKKSKDSRTGKNMSESALAFSLGYRKMYNITRQYEKTNFFYALRYEDILGATEKEIEQVLDFLEVNNREKGESDYYDKIPAPQKPLHSNVKHPLIEQRKTSWAEELPETEIAILESCLKKEISEEGYAFSGKKPETLIQKIKVFQNTTAFFLKYYLAKAIPGPYSKLSSLKEKILKD